MPDVEVRNIPFKEAVRFLQDKTRITSKRWDDMLGPIHAKAFTVAGLTKIEALKDLHDSLNRAIQNGGTIADFRKDFDKMVAKYGWSYFGKRGWRTSLIYRQNLLSAQMAGRWQQIWRVRDERPFLQYLTVDDNRVRQDHRKWHKAVFPVTHKIWQIIYPPNDYLCRCIVRSLSRDDMTEEGLRVSPKDLPEKVTITDPKTGEQYEIHQGIGRGFDYNVGQQWLAPDALLGQQLMDLPSDMRNNAIKWFDTEVYDRPFKSMVNEVAYRIAKGDGVSIGKQSTVGFISGDVIDNMMNRGMLLSSATISVKDVDIIHWLRDKKVDRGVAIPLTAAVEVPKIIRQPDAVLYDTEDPALLYVKRLTDGRYVKLVVKLNFKTRLNHNERRFNLLLNNIKTAGIVLASNLTAQRYAIIEGEISE